MKKLHDLLVLKITKEDKERKKFPLAQIVGRVGVKWEPEFPVDRGWVDIYVPRQENIKEPYAIGVETGYDLNCSKILQQQERFKRALTRRIPHVRSSVTGFTKIVDTGPSTIPPNLCVVIPKDFAGFIPLFEPKEISVFLWEAKLEWECKKCNRITLGEGPWKPSKCMQSSCNGKEKSLHLVGIKDFKLEEAYRVPLTFLFFLLLAYSFRFSMLRNTAAKLTATIKIRIKSLLSLASLRRKSPGS